MIGMPNRCAWALLAALPALMALNATAQDVTVKDAWVRATVPGQRATGAFMGLTASRDAVLVSASSPVAGVVELHEMVMDGSVMRMRALPKLELPAGQRVELKPGGYHVMLMDLRQTLKPGDVVPLGLRIEVAGSKPADIAVRAEVRELGAHSPMKR
jgi:hypothetical protein